MTQTDILFSVLLCLGVLGALLAGARLAYVLGASAIVAFFIAGEQAYLPGVPHRIFYSLDVFAFMAMPLFILVGEIMNRGGVTMALIDFAMSLVGRLKGGLGHVNVLTSVFFAGISGSAVADAAALGSTLTPAMREKGYKADYAGAITSASAIIGPIIPPSIILIFYGAIMSVDVAALFAAGLVPGILLAGVLMAANTVYAKRENHPGGADYETPPIFNSFLRAAPALTLPFIIVAGIVFGVMTPTEAAGVAVVAAALVAALYKTLSSSLVWNSLKRSASLTGSIFLLIAAASAIGYLAALTQLPQTISAFAVGLGYDGVGYLLVMTVIFLIAGMFIDIPVALAFLAPLLVPAAIATGANEVHVGVLVCLNLCIGLITPPLGGVLIVVSSIMNIDYWRLALRTLPFMALEIILLLVLLFVPDITLALPRALGLM